MSERTFITIKEFAGRIMVGYTKARQLANSKYLCEAGVSVKTNPDNQRGGVRIDWVKYLEYVGKRPPVVEHQKPKLKRMMNS